MRIEIMGPSGVGKSTILRAVQPLWADRLIFPEDIAALIKEMPPAELARTINSFFAADRRMNDYLEYTLRLIALSPMLFNQKFFAIEVVRQNMGRYVLSALADAEGGTVLHDELLLHRGFSFLHLCDDYEADARFYYENVPAPDAAIIFTASPRHILERHVGRNRILNCYRGLSGEDLRLAIARAAAICPLAGEALAKRGVEVRYLDASGSLEDSITQLSGLIAEFVPAV